MQRVMTDSRNELLWRVNNEYRKRLSQAQTYLDLLEQMLLANWSEPTAPDTLDTLRFVSQELRAVAEETRAWRHLFFYESAESKRMVQDDRAITQALSRFSRMRSAHEAHFINAYTLLYQLPRPQPELTRVPTGDLWLMCQYALHDLVTFDDYVGNIQALH